MVAQVEGINARSNSLWTIGRRRMHDEMAEHRRKLEDDLSRHHMHRRQMQESAEESSSKTCSQAHPPLEIQAAKMSISLPFTAEIKIRQSDITVSKDLMKELGVKPKMIPVKFEKTFTFPVIPVR